MLQKTFIAGSVALATFVATPVLAADALTSFNGTNGNGGFFYGYSDYTTPAPVTAFDASGQGAPPCALNGNTTCLFSSTIGNLPQASFGGTFPTVAVPQDALLLHPGDSDSQSVFAGYLAPTTSSYSYSINLESVGRDTGTGVGYTLFTQIGGVKTLGARGLLGLFGSTQTLVGEQALAAGTLFGVILDRNGSYGGDSTGLNFSISAVPEPATWAMMLLGFGMVGFVMRKRAKVRTTVSYA